MPSDQQTNGTFTALPFLWKYEYTGDITFLRDTAYPYLKELGAFWVDFVERNPTTGRYEVRHSGVNEGGDDVNLRPVWQEVLDNLTPYPLGVRDGLEFVPLASQISNPIKGNELLNKNDQPINLEGVVHPSDNLAIGGDPRMLALARNTLQWVDPFLPGSRGSSGNGFPKTFTIAARVGWPAEDLIGSIETVNSMFLQTYQGVTRVFPAWPDARNAKFVRLRAKGAFLLSSEQRAGTVQNVTVVSEKGNPFALANPWGHAPVSVVDGSSQPIAHTNTGGVVSFPTRAGNTYRIART